MHNIFLTSGVDKFFNFRYHGELIGLVFLIVGVVWFVTMVGKDKWFNTNLKAYSFTAFMFLIFVAIVYYFW